MTASVFKIKPYKVIARTEKIVARTDKTFVKIMLPFELKACQSAVQLAVHVKISTASFETWRQCPVTRQGI